MKDKPLLWIDMLERLMWILEETKGTASVDVRQNKVHLWSNSKEAVQFDNSNVNPLVATKPTNIVNVHRHNCWNEMLGVKLTPSLLLLLVHASNGGYKYIQNTASKSMVHNHYNCCYYLVLWDPHQNNMSMESLCSHFNYHPFLYGWDYRTSLVHGHGLLMFK